MNSNFSRYGSDAGLRPRISFHQDRVRRSLGSREMFPSLKSDEKKVVIQPDNLEELASLFHHEDPDALQELDATNSNIQDEDLSKLLAKFKKLSTINLSQCDEMSNKSLKILSGSSVKRLILDYANINDEGMAYLENVPLTQLRLVGCHHVTDNGMAALKKMPLTHFTLSDCSITEEGLTCLKEKQLQSLDLCGVWLSDKAFEMFSSMPLQRLSLTRCGSDFTKKGLECLPASLKHLELASQSHITDVELEALASYALEHVSVMNCAQITDRGLMALANVHSLTELTISSCYRITNAGLAHLMRLPNLTSLVISNCDQISDAGVACLATRRWQHLSLESCPNVTQAGHALLDRLKVFRG